jgi:hypothetical protein
LSTSPWLSARQLSLSRCSVAVSSGDGGPVQLPMCRNRDMITRAPQRPSHVCAKRGDQVRMAATVSGSAMFIFQDGEGSRMV